MENVDLIGFGNNTVGVQVLSGAPRRKNALKNTEKSQPLPLYKIVDGKRIEIPFPEKIKKTVSPKEAFRIKK